jgi:hypothetical protein
VEQLLQGKPLFQGHLEGGRIPPALEKKLLVMQVTWPLSQTLSLVTC